MHMEKEKSWGEWIYELDDPKKNREKPEALDHITVLDVSYANMAGCFATSTLRNSAPRSSASNRPEATPPGPSPPGATCTWTRAWATSTKAEQVPRDPGPGVGRRPGDVSETGQTGRRPGGDLSARHHGRVGIGYRQLKELNPSSSTARSTPTVSSGPRPPAARRTWSGGPGLLGHRVGERRAGL